MDSPKMSNTYIAVGVLAALVFAHWILITPRLMTKESFKEEFKETIQSYSGRIKAEAVHAEAFMLHHDIHKNIGGGMWIMDEGYPVIYIYQEEYKGSSAKDDIALSLSKNESIGLQINHRNGNELRVMTDGEKSVVAAKADLFVGVQGNRITLVADEHSSFLHARNKQGDTFLPKK